jgi:DNA-binding protein H-NS
MRALVLFLSTARGDLNGGIECHGSPAMIRSHLEDRPMVSYQELLRQRLQLEADIAAARAAERRAAIAQIRRLMCEYRLTTRDVLPARTARRTRPQQGRAFYQDPVSGALWSGRGRPPRCLDGKERDLYRVSGESTETVSE